MTTTPPDYDSSAGPSPRSRRSSPRTASNQDRTASGRRLPLGGVLLWVALAALLLWRAPGAPASIAAQATDEDGFLLIAGVYLPPPYTVSLDGDGVSVNGYLLQPSQREPLPHTRRPIDETAARLDAWEQIELARRFYQTTDDSAPNAARVAATAAYLRGLTAAGRVEVNGSAISVIDDGGEVAELILTPLGDAPAGEDRDPAAMFARSLRESLAGRLVIVSGDGALITMSRGDGVALLRTAVESFDAGLAPAERGRRLADLVAPAVAEEIAENLEPDDALRARLAAAPAAPRPEDEQRGGYAPAIAGDRQADPGLWNRALQAQPGHRPPVNDPGEHPDSETPGRKTALLYSTVSNNAEGRPYRVAANVLHDIKADLELQDYQVSIVTSVPLVRYVKVPGRKELIASPRPVPLARISWLMEPWGVLFLSTHGSPGGWLAVERFTDRDEAFQARDRYRDRVGTFPNAVADDFEVTSDSLGAYYVKVSKGFIARNWRDADTVAFIDACWSNSFTDTDGTVTDNYAGGFALAGHWPLAAPATGPGAREFIGYDGEVEMVQGALDARLFFSHMAARADLDDGKRRPAARAFLQIAHYDATSREGNALRRRQGLDTHTVLSPAVIDVEVLPADGDVIVDTEWHVGRVRFDGRPTTAWSPNFVVKETGCIEIDRRERPPQWTRADAGSALGVTFRYRAIAPGRATLRVPEYMASSRNNRNDLDGNQSPAGPPDHVGPNRDDYVWRVTCLPAETPATQSTPPPSPAPTPTPSTTTPSPSPAGTGLPELLIDPFTRSPAALRVTDGATVQFSFTVRNTGTAAATNVTVQLNKEEEQGGVRVEGVPPVPAAPAPGGTTCQFGGDTVLLRCTIAEIGPGASVTFVAVYRLSAIDPRTESVVRFTASVNGQGAIAESNPNNNSAANAVVVVPAAGQPAVAPSPTPQPGMGPAGAGGARLEPSTSTGRVGQTFTLSAGGFTPNSSVRICVVGPGGACAVELFSGSTGNGSFSVPCTVPNLQPGVYTIDATDARGVRAATMFTVVR